MARSRSPRVIGRMVSAATLLRSELQRSSHGGNVARQRVGESLAPCNDGARCGLGREKGRPGGVDESALEANRSRHERGGELLHVAGLVTVARQEKERLRQERADVGGF